MARAFKVDGSSVQGRLDPSTKRRDWTDSSAVAERSMGRRLERSKTPRVDSKAVPGRTVDDSNGRWLTRLDDFVARARRRDFPAKTQKKPPAWGGVSAFVVSGGFHPTSPPRVVLRPPCGLPLLLPRLRASESHSESAVGLLGEQGSHEASHRCPKGGGRRATVRTLSLSESSQQLLSHLQAERLVHLHLLHTRSVGGR